MSGETILCSNQSEIPYGFSCMGGSSTHLWAGTRLGFVYSRDALTGVPIPSQSFKVSTDPFDAVTSILCDGHLLWIGSSNGFLSVYVIPRDPQSNCPPQILQRERHVYSPINGIVRIGGHLWSYSEDGLITVHDRFSLHCKRHLYVDPSTRGKIVSLFENENSVWSLTDSGAVDIWPIDHGIHPLARSSTRKFGHHIKHVLHTGECLWTARTNPLTLCQFDLKDAIVRKETAEERKKAMKDELKSDRKHSICSTDVTEGKEDATIHLSRSVSAEKFAKLADRLQNKIEDEESTSMKTAGIIAISGAALISSIFLRHR
jgi:hypothetical protein